MYAFMDVVCDGLMVESGRRYELTPRFQSIQWGSVYVASVITGYSGGWVAEHLSPQTNFLITSIFPLTVLTAGGA